MSALRFSRGAALITAMLVAALATMLITTLMENLDLRIARQQSRNDGMKALAIARGGVLYARAVIAEDARRTSTDHRGEAWTARLPPIEFDLGEVSGYLEDAQGLWNLNNLAPEGVADEEQVAMFRRLLGHLNLSNELADHLTDWIDTNSAVRGGGSEDAWYLAQVPQRVASNHPLIAIETLLEVRGFSQEVITRLRPHVTVLVGRQPINLNFATPPVLAALVPGLSLAEASKLTAERDRIPFRDVADFQGRLPSGMNVSNIPHSVTSHHFNVHIIARSGRSQMRWLALLRRDTGGTGSRVEWAAAR